MGRMASQIIKNNFANQNILVLEPRIENFEKKPFLAFLRQNWQIFDQLPRRSILAGTVTMKWQFYPQNHFITFKTLYKSPKVRSVWVKKPPQIHKMRFCR